VVPVVVVVVVVVVVPDGALGAVLVGGGLEGVLVVSVLVEVVPVSVPVVPVVELDGCSEVVVSCPPPEVFAEVVSGEFVASASFTSGPPRPAAVSPPPASADSAARSALRRAARPGVRNSSSRIGLSLIFASNSSPQLRDSPAEGSYRHVDADP